MKTRLKRRPILDAFSFAMEQVLRDNDWKGGWDDLSGDWLIGKLREEFQEVVDCYKTSNYFESPMYKHDIERSRRELVDLANVCMIGWDLLGKKEHKEQA